MANHKQNSNFQITKKQLKELLTYNSETGIFTWIKGRRKGYEAGSIDYNKYTRISILRKLYMAHRLAWLYTYGYFPKEYIDHKNGEKSDNRIINLREATNTENQQNKNEATISNLSCGLRGVTKIKGNRKKKWQATIRAYGKQIYLGVYLTPELANKSYLKAKNKMQPFAILNNK